MPLTTSEHRPRHDLSSVSPQIESSANSMKPAHSSPFNAVPWQGASRPTPGNQILRASNTPCGINSQVNGAPPLTTPYSTLSEGPNHDGRYGGGNETIAIPGKDLFPTARPRSQSLHLHVKLRNEEHMLKKLDQWQEYGTLSRLPDTPRPQGPFTPSLTAESPHSQHSSGYSADFNAWTPETNTAITDGTTHSPIMNLDSLIPPSINFSFLLDANGQPASFYPAMSNQDQYDMIPPMEDQTHKPPDRRLTRTASNEPRVKIEPTDSPFLPPSASNTVGMPILPRRGPPIDVGTIPARFVNLMGQPSNYAWEIPIRSVTPTCKVDETLLSFIQDRRRLALEGVRDTDLVGPKNPSISSLLNPTQNNTSHPVSNVLTKLLCNLPALVTIPEKIALLWTMYLLLRVSPLNPLPSLPLSPQSPSPLPPSTLSTPLSLPFPTTTMLTPPPPPPAVANLPHSPNLRILPLLAHPARLATPNAAPDLDGPGALAQTARPAHPPPGKIRHPRVPPPAHGQPVRQLGSPAHGRVDLLSS